MSEEKTGTEKAREMAEKLKAESVAEELKKESAGKAAMSELEKIHNNPELQKMYADNAKVGSENIGGSFPYLKVHAVGKASNKLADGTPPNDGWFFYTPTKEQIQIPRVHITTISRGFRAPGMPDAQGKTKIVFNQILAGLLIDGDDYRPFLMFVTGGKLSKMWKFGKEISNYTHAKPVPIPMFALTVALSTSKVDSAYGEQWTIDFHVELNEDKSPKLIADVGRFSFVREMVGTIEQMVQALIASKEVKTEEDTPLKGEEVPVEDNTPIAATTNGDVNPDDIPF